MPLDQGDQMTAAVATDEQITLRKTEAGPGGPGVDEVSLPFGRLLGMSARLSWDTPFSATFLPARMGQTGPERWRWGLYPTRARNSRNAQPGDHRGTAGGEPHRANRKKRP